MNSEETESPPRPATTPAIETSVPDIISTDCRVSITIQYIFSSFHLIYHF